MDQFITWGPGMKLDDLEKQCILKSYAFYRNNKTATASALGISIRTLDAKLQRYEKEDASEKEQKREEREKNLDFLQRQRGTGPNNLYASIPNKLPNGHLK